MNFWLVKSEPESYSFSQLRRDKITAWTGVRNFQARNFLKSMEKGDLVFFYHSVTEKAVVGIASVVKTAYPDPTADNEKKDDWLCVDLKAGQVFSHPVPLGEIKKTPALKEMALLRQARLSVQPVKAPEAAELKRLGGL